MKQHYSFANTLSSIMCFRKSTNGDIQGRSLVHHNAIADIIDEIEDILVELFPPPLAPINSYTPAISAFIWSTDIVDEAQFDSALEGSTDIDSQLGTPTSPMPYSSESPYICNNFCHNNCFVNRNII